MRQEKDWFILTDSKDDIDINLIITSIQSTYWGGSYTSADINKSIDNSTLISLFKDNSQIGFARIISDYAIFSFLDDVFIVKEYRGIGLGKYMMDFIVNHPAMNVKSSVLATRDQHGFYEKFGFKRSEMMRKNK